MLDKYAWSTMEFQFSDLSKPLHFCSWPKGFEYHLDNQINTEGMIAAIKGCQAMLAVVNFHETRGWSHHLAANVSEHCSVKTGDFSSTTNNYCIQPSSF